MDLICSRYWCLSGLKKKEYLNKVIVLCGIVVFPVAMFLIYVMAPNSYCYTLMAYSVVFFFVFFLLWLDACFRNLKLHAPVKSITNWVSALLTAALVIVFVWYANGNYMALEYTKYHDFPMCRRWSPRSGVWRIIRRTSR